MIGYVNVREQVDKDFHRALLKASLRRWRSRMRRESNRERLLSFDEAKDTFSPWSQVYRGMRIVEVEKITGSVGRSHDFDGSFLPRNRSTNARWSRVDSAYHQGVELPAVSLYKIGDEYFVRDGNHRVSVARYHKVAAIDAEVVEIRGRLRKDASPRTRAKAAPAAHQPIRPAGSRVSWLHALWRCLRPDLSGMKSATS
jgi:hypothetical protein